MSSNNASSGSVAKLVSAPADVDLAALTYGNPKKLDRGGKIVPIYYKGAPLLLQTPPLRAPFGMNAWTPEGGGPTKYSLNLSLAPGGEEMQALLERMDAKLLQDGCASSAAWLNKTGMTEEVARALYTPMVKASTKGDFPPTFKVTLPHSQGAFACEFYDAQRNRIELESIPKRSVVTAICQCTGVWAMGGRFGCSWKVLQLRYVPPPATGTGGFGGGGGGARAFGSNEASEAPAASVAHTNGFAFLRDDADD